MPHDEDVPDYEPLSRDEVAALLDEAAQCAGRLADGQQTARPAEPGPAGNTCPKQIDGPVAERRARLKALYVDRYQEGGTPELTDAVWSILTEGPAA